MGQPRRPQPETTGAARSTPTWVPDGSAGGDGTTSSSRRWDRRKPFQPGAIAGSLLRPHQESAASGVAPSEESPRLHRTAPVPCRATAVQSSGQQVALRHRTPGTNRETPRDFGYRCPLRDRTPRWWPSPSPTARVASAPRPSIWSHPERRAGQAQQPGAKVHSCRVPRYLPAHQQRTAASRERERSSLRGLQRPAAHGLVGSLSG
mgnify:CR=1 FL=1